MDRLKQSVRHGGPGYVLDSTSNRRELLLTLVILLMLCGSSLAQSPANSSPNRPFSSPPSLTFDDPSESVSSEEFERFISKQTPDPANLRAVPSVPSHGLLPVSEFTLPPPSRSELIPDVATLGTPLPDPNQQPGSMLRGPWWEESSRLPLLATEDKACPVDLEQLVWLSMRHSPRVQSILLVPKIQRTEIDIARGDLDPRRFARSNYHNTSDPVGNTLTTGGPNRLNEQFWENSAGIRDRNALGGKTELAQLLNARDNNSLFFKPNNQADTKMTLNYTQPLMRGAGKFYNTSTITLSDIKTKSTIASANRQLQDHAMEVITTYWELVRHRYLMLQSQRAQERLRQIKAQMLNRQGIDLLPSHIARADAAIHTQQGQIETAKANIKTKEAVLRQLVNAPEFEIVRCKEILPLTQPTVDLPSEPIEAELLSAVRYRGDIQAIQQAIETATVQQKLAVNELRPTLDFMADSYVRGLRGNNDFGQAWVNQFDRGRPSFSAGLDYQNPVGNRSAKANLQGRRLELAKLMNDYSDALNKARADIDSAYENSKGTYASALAAIEGTWASKEEVESHQAKFRDFFGDNPSVSNILNDLLDAENRLLIAENTWANRQIAHMQALAEIKFQAGTLMTISADDE